MLEYSAAFSHLKIIGWHFEAGWGGVEGGREGEREAVCQKDWSRGIVMTSRSFLSFFLSSFLAFHPSLPAHRQKARPHAARGYVILAGRGGPVLPGDPRLLGDSSAPAPCRKSGALSPMWGGGASLETCLVSVHIYQNIVSLQLPSEWVSFHLGPAAEEIPALPQPPVPRTGGADRRG